MGREVGKGGRSRETGGGCESQKSSGTGGGGGGGGFLGLNGIRCPARDTSSKKRTLFFTEGGPGSQASVKGGRVSGSSSSTSNSGGFSKVRNRSLVFFFPSFLASLARTFRDSALLSRGTSSWRSQRLVRLRLESITSSSSINTLGLAMGWTELHPTLEVWRQTNWRTTFFLTAKLQL